MNEQTAYETFSARFIAMPGLRRRAAKASAQRRSRADLAVPAHAVTAGRIQLPPSADLLGLWRRGHRALRTVGRRLDDAGAAAALPALGHLGHRQRAADQTGRRALVSAMALRALARRQRALRPAQSRHSECALLLRGELRL